MGRAKEYAEWSRTCAIIATVANMFRDKNTKPITAEALNPYRENVPRTREVLPGRIEDLKVFLRT